MDEIIDEISKRYGITKTLARIIITSPFHYIRENLHDGNFKNFGLMHLGKFVVRQNKRVRAEKYAEDIKKRKQIKRDLQRLEESDLERPGDREDGI
jgi:nucleoid DNA-binding protein